MFIMKLFEKKNSQFAEKNRALQTKFLYILKEKKQVYQ
jgi:hypothetical protein